MSFSVSVVIPSYQRSDFLLSCLNALSKQSFDPNQFEVIVVDDGSPNFLEKKKNLLNIVWPFSFTLLHQENAGPAAARNRGIKNAKAEIIAFLDDDTQPDARWLEHIISPIVKGKAEGVAGHTQGGLEKNTWVSWYLNKSQHLNAHHVGDDGALFYIITANCAFSKDILLEIDGFDEHFPFPAGEDLELGIRLKAAGARLVKNPNAIVDHHHKDNYIQMFKNWFVYGRGTALCKKKHPQLDFKGTAPENKIDGRWIRKALGIHFSRLLESHGWKHFTENFLYTFFELSNQGACQLGFLFQAVFFKAKTKNPYQNEMSKNKVNRSNG